MKFRPVQPDGGQSILEMTWLVERYQQCGGIELPKAAKELDRFFVLTTRTERPLAMISPIIDSLWHHAIEFTEFYAKHCSARYGQIIHHRSHTRHTPVGSTAIVNFFDVYEEEYGDLSEIWFKRTPINLLEIGRRKTTELDEMVAWSGWPGRVHS